MNNIEVFSDTSGLKIVDIDEQTISTTSSNKKGLRKTTTTTTQTTITNNSKNLYKADFGLVDSLKEGLDNLLSSWNKNNKNIIDNSTTATLNSPVSFNTPILIAAVVLLLVIYKG